MDAKDKGGYTAVMLAAVNKHEKVMKFEIISAINTCSSCLKRGVFSAMPQFFKRWIALSDAINWCSSVDRAIHRINPYPQDSDLSGG